ncbi:hypothetical protein CBM2599_A150038 [Cupriavidus taiwanensis]|nr:hypothetical protein CBM2599_A150038 [Cupriavidus taiwanensis]SOY84566.1 hypothetical protein CBM2600_A140038 [Cupriavidus taiwanensis]
MHQQATQRPHFVGKNCRRCRIDDKRLCPLKRCPIHVRVCRGIDNDVRPVLSNGLSNLAFIAQVTTRPIKDDQLPKAGKTAHQFKADLPAAPRKEQRWQASLTLHIALLPSFDTRRT